MGLFNWMTTFYVSVVSDFSNHISVCVYNHTDFK